MSQDAGVHPARTPASVLRRAMTLGVDWLHEPVSSLRVLVLRRLVYVFVIVDVLWWHTSGEYHGWIDGRWYHPLVIGELLPLPTPDLTIVQAVKWGCVATALLALSGRSPRLLGWTVAALWFEYQVIAFSYGKVDHDRWAMLVALVLLPTVGAVNRLDQRRSERAGWAIRCVQLAVIATYFYAGWAKLRFGGPDWVNSATLTRAVVRRGTDLAQPLLDAQWILHLSQWGIMTMELSAPLIFLLNARWRRWAIAGLLGFHVVTYSMITIIFLPHVVCLAAFLPLERLVRRAALDKSEPSGQVSVPTPRTSRALVGRQRARRRTAGEPTAVVGHQPVDPGGHPRHGRHEHQPTQRGPGPTAGH